MKRIIITGASDGLGKAFGQLGVEQGVEIICLSRTKPDYNCIHIETDLSDEKSIENAVAIIKDKYSKFDALINNAATQSIQKVGDISFEELDKMMRINSMAPIYLTSLLFDLIKQNEADIMNVGSTVGFKAQPSQCVYGTNKWGMRGTSANFALELANTKCRVMQFNPGGMNTDFLTKQTGIAIPDPENWMEPKNMAELMLYLLRLPKSLEVSDIQINRKKA